MAAISIILFFFYMWSLGFLLGSLVKESKNLLERNLMRLGIGMGLFLFLGIVFNMLRIPLDWKIFLFLGIVILLYYFYKNYNFIKNFMPVLKVTKANASIILMLILFSITFYMYHKGAFIYPYLENDDSWSHAVGVKYVSIEKTVFAGVKNPFHYIDPYPPSYDMLIGILHQTNSSVYWSLKFFNALIISLSIIFFYFFVKVFTSSYNKALFSTFALFAVPAYLSHFIWAIALTMPLIFISFYAIEKINRDKKWWIIAGIVIVPTITSSPTHSTYFGLLFIIYLIARTIVERRILIYTASAGLFGLLLSYILWWLPAFLGYGFTGTLKSLGIGIGSGSPAFSISGTGDRIYKLSDFIFAKDVNMINNPIGIGVVLSILAVVGFAYLSLKYKKILEKENYYMLVLILWFVFAFYAVNAARFPVKLSPFRAWMILAIPVALLSGEAINLINNFVKTFFRNLNTNKALIAFSSFIALSIIAYGVITTSFIQKYTVNTAQWPPGAFWTSNEEIQGYIWFKDNIPSETKVFTFSNNALIIALDKFICSWCDEVRDYQKNGFNQSVLDNYNWLKRGQYKYIIIDGQTARRFGANETNNKVNELLSSGLFKPIHNTGGFLLLQLSEGII